MYMKLKDGKSKVLTFSYDDGFLQDIRLMEIFDRYGLRATFNINTGQYFPEDGQRQEFYGRMKLSEAQALYTHSGHEVAVHGLNHLFLERLGDAEVITEIMEDRKNLARQYGTLARGMAYPYGTYSEKVVDILEKCGICYARTTRATRDFRFPENWLIWDPTCHHGDPELMGLAEKFTQEKLRYSSENRLLYVWGHSYEFHNGNNWQIIEEFARYMGGREDVWYATNMEIYDYVRAYQQLQTSADMGIVHNPCATDVWFSHREKTYCVPGGQTIAL